MARLKASEGHWHKDFSAKVEERAHLKKVCSTGSSANTGPAPIRPIKAAREAEAQQRGAFTKP